MLMMMKMFIMMMISDGKDVEDDVGYDEWLGCPGTMVLAVDYVDDGDDDEDDATNGEEDEDDDDHEDV